MTVSSQVNRSQFLGNGSTGPFTTGMAITTDSWVKVYRQLVGETSATLLTLTTHYTIATGSNATITFTSSIAADTTITIVREVPRTQASDYVNNTDFTNSTIEASLDKITYAIQDQDEKLARAIKFDAAVDDAYLNMTLPSPTADALLKWKNDLSGIENVTLASSDGLTVPVPILQGGTGATTVADAKNNLGLGSTSSPDFANIIINDAGSLRLEDADGSNYVAIKAPAVVASNVTLTLPDSAGSSGQTLITNGSGTLSWGNFNSGTVTSVATGSGLSGGTITGTGTISLDIPGLTADTAPDITADYTITYDASATANKKVLLGDIPVNINGLTQDTSPDGAADYTITYDASAGSNKKVLLNNLPINISGLTEDVAPDINNDFLASYDTSATTNKKIKPSSIGAGSGNASPNLIVNPSFIAASGSEAVAAAIYTYPDNTFFTNNTYSSERAFGIQWKGLVNSAGSDISIYMPNVIGSSEAQSNISPYSIKFKNPTSALKHGIMQTISSIKTVPLRGQNVNLSVFLKRDSGADQDVRIALLSWAGTIDTPTDPVSAWNAAGTNPTLAASWSYINTPASLAITSSYVRYNVSGSVPTGANNIAILIWRETGSTTDYVWVNAPTLVTGLVAGSYFYNPGMEDQEALSYYEMAGARPRDSVTSGVPLGTGFYTTTTNFIVNHVFQKIKYKAPTCTIPVPADFDVVSNTGTLAITAATASTQSVGGGLVNYTTSAATAGAGGIIQRDATSSYSCIHFNSQV